MDPQLEAELDLLQTADAIAKHQEAEAARWEAAGHTRWGLEQKRKLNLGRLSELWQKLPHARTEQQSASVRAEIYERETLVAAVEKELAELPPDPAADVIPEPPIIPIKAQVIYETAIDPPGVFRPRAFGGGRPKEVGEVNGKMIRDLRGELTQGQFIIGCGRQSGKMMSVDVLQSAERGFASEKTLAWICRHPSAKLIGRKPIDFKKQTAKSR